MVNGVEEGRKAGKSSKGREEHSPIYLSLQSTVYALCSGLQWTALSLADDVGVYLVVVAAVSSPSIHPQRAPVIHVSQGDLA